MTVLLQEKSGELFLPIPANVAVAAGLKPGEELTLTTTDGSLTAKRNPIRRIPLEDLIAQIKPENLHGEIDWGPPVGREVW